MDNAKMTLVVQMASTSSRAAFIACEIMKNVNAGKQVQGKYLFGKFSEDANEALKLDNKDLAAGLGLAYTNGVIKDDTGLIYWAQVEGSKNGVKIWLAYDSKREKADKEWREKLEKEIRFLRLPERVRDEIFLPELVKMTGPTDRYYITFDSFMKAIKDLKEKGGFLKVKRQADGCLFFQPAPIDFDVNELVKEIGETKDPIRYLSLMLFKDGDIEEVKADYHDPQDIFEVSKEVADKNYKTMVAEIEEQLKSTIKDLKFPPAAEEKLIQSVTGLDTLEEATEAAHQVDCVAAQPIGRFVVIAKQNDTYGTIVTATLEDARGAIELSQGTGWAVEMILERKEEGFVEVPE